LVQKNLGEGLELHAGGGYFCIFRDHSAGLEYIHNSQELFDKGLYVELGAFKYRVFLDFREVQDDVWQHYAHLAAHLNGRGVPGVEEAMRELFLQPIRQLFKELVNAEMFRRLMDGRLIEAGGQVDRALLDEVEQKMIGLLREIKQFTGSTGDELTIAHEVCGELDTLLTLPVLETRFPMLGSPEVVAATEYLRANLNGDPYTWGSLLAWLAVHRLGEIVDAADFESRSRSWIDQWQLGSIIAGALQELGAEPSAAWQAVGVVKLLTTHQRSLMLSVPEEKQVPTILQSLLEDGEVQQFLRVNRHNDVLWFNHEAFNQLLGWLLLVATVETSADPLRPATEVVESFLEYYTIVQKLHAAEQKSGYQVEKLLAAEG
jgi:hypothetical protein